MLRLLANENIPGDAVTELRRRGHDVLWVRSDFAGATDDVVLARAVAEQRLLITFDKDFGELVYKRGRQASHGVVLFRFAVRSPAHVTQRIASALESRGDWSGMFTVVEDDRMRMTAIP